MSLSNTLQLERCYGWLVHLPCLPSPYGIGDFAAAAKLIDALTAAGAKLWQLLPLHPPGYGNSPYSAFSAFALDPLLISPQWLLKSGMLPASSLQTPPPVPSDYIDYATVARWKNHLFVHAYQRWREHRCGYEALEHFRKQEQYWLEDFALFWIFKQQYHHQPWYQWPAPARDRDPLFLREAKGRYAEQFEFITFLQWIAAQQLSQLRAIAHAAEVILIGDMPIFVAYDSADVWAHPELFKLDAQRRPTVVAGVPPDYFSPTGQRWGNPQYRWRNHKEENFRWWTQRFQRLLQWFDYIRVDHFRGFAAVWEIPATAPDARRGKWVRVPGRQLFRHLFQTFQQLPIIAEDLGLITPDVIKLRDTFGFPGMRVLQFGLESSDPAHPFLPQNFETPHTVCYTGTHDNDTSLGWFLQLNAEQQTFIRRLSGREQAVDIVEWMIDYALFSTAKFAIIPLHDILLLGSEARLNVPGRSSGNWVFRFATLPSPERLAELRERSYLANRLSSSLTATAE